MCRFAYISKRLNWHKFTANANWIRKKDRALYNFVSLPRTNPCVVSRAARLRHEQRITEKNTKYPRSRMIRSSTNMRNERDIKCMKILFMFTHVNAHNSRTTYDAARCRHERAFRTRISRAVECQGFCTLISRLSHQVKCTAPRAHMCR